MTKVHYIATFDILQSYNTVFIVIRSQVVTYGHAHDILAYIQQKCKPEYNSQLDTSILVYRGGIAQEVEYGPTTTYSHGNR